MARAADTGSPAERKRSPLSWLSRIAPSKKANESHGPDGSTLAAARQENLEPKRFLTVSVKRKREKVHSEDQSSSSNERRRRSQSLKDVLRGITPFHRAQSASGGSSATSMPSRLLRTVGTPRFPPKDSYQPPPFRFMDLPGEIRLQILCLYIQKPDEFIFNEWRMRENGTFLCQYDASLSRFRGLLYGCKSRALSADLRQWVFSTSTFTFQYRPAFIQFLRRIGPQNLKFVRRIVFALPIIEYFHLFTPFQIIRELKIPLRSLDRLFLWPTFQQMALTTVTIRLNQTVQLISERRRGASSSKLNRWHDYHPDYAVRISDEEYATSLDQGWVIKSVTQTLSSVLGNRVPNIKFETAQAPHTPVVYPPSLIVSWEALIAAGMHHEERRSALRLWLMTKSEFLLFCEFGWDLKYRGRSSLLP